MKVIGLIWLGGGIGSVMRYLVQIWVSRFTNLSFPLGTFLVNVSGCFLIGIFFALAEKYNIINYEWRLFLITGLCGGFTTFSTFSYEGVNLFKEGNYAYFISYILLSVGIGLLATVFGFSLFK